MKNAIILSLMAFVLGFGTGAVTIYLWTNPPGKNDPGTLVERVRDDRAKADEADSRVDRGIEAVSSGLRDSQGRAEHLEQTSGDFRELNENFREFLDSH